MNVEKNSTRWKFRLRSLLLSWLVVSLVIGRWANTAQTQRAAVANLRELAPNVRIGFEKTPCLGWLTAYLDGHYVRRVVEVQLDAPESDETSKALLRSIVSLAHLQHLQFDSPFIGDNEIMQLCKLRELRGLEIGNSQISDDGLDDLAQINLRLLRINNTPIKGHGLEYLAQIETLEVLVLIGTQIRDEDLSHLRRLPNLETVCLQDTKVTTDGAGNLQKALPNCQVKF